MTVRHRIVLWLVLIQTMQIDLVCVGRCSYMGLIPLDVWLAMLQDLLMFLGLMFVISFFC